MQCERVATVGSSISLVEVLLLRAYLYFEQTSVARVGEDFKYTLDSKPQEILPSFRTLPNEAKQTLDRPDNGATRAKAPSCQRAR